MKKDAQTATSPTYRLARHPFSFAVAAVDLDFDYSPTTSSTK